MEVYTNSSQVKELITIQTNIEVEPFDNHVPESKEVDVFLLDDHLLQLQDRYREDKACLHETTLLRRRPDWGGMILEMMKYNEHVHLFNRRWYRIYYNPQTYYFKFKLCDTPNLVARHSCILSYPVLLSSEEKQTLQVLLQPVIFGEQLANRLKEANVLDDPSSMTSAGGDYEKLCLNLEQVTLRLKHQKDLWKDRFFITAFGLPYFEN